VIVIPASRAAEILQIATDIEAVEQQIMSWSKKACRSARRGQN